MRYQIQLGPHAVKFMRDLGSNPVKAKIAKKIDGLSQSPELQGKPLIGPLLGCRALKISRYRAIFRIRKTEVLVLVPLVGLRAEGSKSDVYQEALRLVARTDFDF